MPHVTSCVRTPDGALLVIDVTAREGAVPLHDCAFRLSAGTDPVGGRDPIEDIGTAVGNRQPRLITATAEWKEGDGCWDILLVDDIDDPREVKVADVVFDDACDLKLHRLDIEGDTLEVHLFLTIPIEGLDEASRDAAVAAQDERIDPLDDLDNDDWKVCVTDHDDGQKVAWWNVILTAKTPRAVAALDVQLARRTPWQRGA